MEPLKFRGIVVRATNVGDYNKMLTVLSPEIGRVSVWARGVKSSKNKNATACSLLCYSELVVSRKGDTFTLSQASVIESFYHLRDSIEKLSCGIYFADLCAEVCESGESAEKVVRLLLNTLYYLERDFKSIPALRAMFEIRLCAEAGFMPSLDACNICGSKEGLEFVSVLHGGSVCIECGGGNMIRVSQGALCTVKGFLNENLKVAITYNCTDEVAEEISKINEKFILNYIGRLPKTLEYLKSLGGM